MATPDIILRAPEPSDVDAMYVWENIESEWIHGISRAPLSRQFLWDYVQSYNPDIFSVGHLRLIIADAVSGEALGCVDLYEFDSLNRRAGVGIVIAPCHRGRGIATEALNMLSHYCFYQVGMHQLWAHVAVGNKPSQSVFEACGYRISGRLRSWIRTGESYADVFVYQRLLTPDCQE